jgi:predicted CopG family antitoxin
MAVKTITIDMEAYELLARHKAEGQSFSQVIKAHFGEQPTAGRLLARLRAMRRPGSRDPDDDFHAQVTKIIRQRKLDPVRVPKL